MSEDNTTVTTESIQAWETFDRTTSRWGRITMLASMVFVIGGPAILAVQLDVEPSAVLGGVLAIALAFGVVWVIEPVSYFPILGPASMYQAFMIGNISNKLLPAAIVAQSAIGAKSGTKRGQLAAVLAICGAAFTHLVSLLLFVGVLGTMIVSLIPAEVTAIVQTFVLPAIMGAVIVQMLAGNPQPRIIAIAAAIGIVVVFVLTPLFPAVSSFAIAIAVAGTVILALFLPPGRKKTAAADHDEALRDVS
ncbi:hypothetical protein [Microbacterium sp. 18062]|uniref:hypothetical protein n=1 Tax=Microbacterium sp. 18062 TaxID=2681410 RepID=UPI0013578AC0|nr:hypothetical protein [Microbacterium sp. 18062]